MGWLWRFLRSVDPFLVLLLALTLPALGPVFAPGYFYGTHDGQHSVFYLAMFDASLRDGALWPRWAMHHIQGYGYPTFVIQAPLGFYLGEFFVLLGAGYTTAAKWSWVVGFVASAWGMYALMRHWLGLDGERGYGGERARGAAALIAGLVYVYAPYHLEGMYVRGALNDTLLFAWYPWVVLAFDRLIVGGREAGWGRRFAIAMAALGGTLLTHTFALISFGPFLAIFALFRALWVRAGDPTTGRDGRQRWVRLGLAAGAGLGGVLLAAVFLVPLLVEGRHLQQQVYVSNTYDYRNHFIYWGQFFSPFWGFAFSDDAAGANDGMGFQLGVMPVLFGVLAVVLLVRDERRGTVSYGLMGYFTVALAVVLVLMTPSSAWLWEGLPMLAVIQFPWRLLGLATFAASLLAGLVMWRVAEWRANGEGESVAGGLVIGLLVVYAGYGYVGATLEPVEAWREDGRAVFRFEREHPDMIAYTEWVEEPFVESPMTADYTAEDYVEEYGEVFGEGGRLTRLAFAAGSGEILSQYSRGSSAGGVVRADGPATVRVHLLYFPGWRATVDGNLVEVRVSPPHGLVEVDVPPGEHRIDVWMEATAARTAGSVAAWAALTVVGVLWFWPRSWAQGGVQRDEAEEAEKGNSARVE